MIPIVQLCVCDYNFESNIKLSSASINATNVIIILVALFFGDTDQISFSLKQFFFY